MAANAEIVVLYTRASAVEYSTGVYSLYHNRGQYDRKIYSDVIFIME